MLCFFESHAYINLGYEDLKELGPGEIDLSPGGRTGSAEARRQDANLFFPLGILWISNLHL